MALERQHTPPAPCDERRLELRWLAFRIVAYMKSRSGRRKVMFGTNYPMVSHQQALDGVDGLGSEDEGRHLFLAGNAQRVLSLPFD
jgi:uncharacterized protein